LGSIQNDRKGSFKAPFSGRAINPYAGERGHAIASWTEKVGLFRSVLDRQFQDNSVTGRNAASMLAPRLWAVVG
jgi:hypothetical protein